MLAKDERSGLTINHPVREAIIAQARALALDVFTVDPFIRSHGISENDNAKIDAVCHEFKRIAREAKLAVGLVHHVRKTGGAEITAEDARGGSALRDAVRQLEVLNPMTEDEAKAGLVRERWRHFRADDGKANMRPPGAGARWYELKSISLGNARTGLAGDHVGVATAWEWPHDPRRGLPDDALQLAGRPFARAPGVQMPGPSCGLESPSPKPCNSTRRTSLTPIRSASASSCGSTPASSSNTRRLTSTGCLKSTSSRRANERFAAVQQCFGGVLLQLLQKRVRR